MSVIHPACMVPVALMLAVTVGCVIAGGMVATLMDSRVKEVSCQGL